MDVANPPKSLSIGFQGEDMSGLGLEKVRLSVDWKSGKSACEVNSRLRLLAVVRVVENFLSEKS